MKKERKRKKRCILSNVCSSVVFCFYFFGEKLWNICNYTVLDIKERVGSDVRGCTIHALDGPRKWKKAGKGRCGGVGRGVCADDGEDEANADTLRCTARWWGRTAPPECRVEPFWVWKGRKTHNSRWRRMSSLAQAGSCSWRTPKCRIPPWTAAWRSSPSTCARKSIGSSWNSPNLAPLRQKLWWEGCWQK